MKSMDKLTTGVAYGTSAGSAGYILRAPRRMRVADAVAQYMRVPKGFAMYRAMSLKSAMMTMPVSAPAGACWR